MLLMTPSASLASEVVLKGTIDIPFLLNDETDAVTFHAVIAWAGSFGLFYRAVACDVLNESLHSTIRMALLLKFLYAVPTLW